MKKLIILSWFFAAMTFGFISCELVEDEEDIDDVEVINMSITSNVIWDANSYTIDGSLYIQDGGHLTIEPGTTVKFLESGKIVVTGSNSTLTAIGTASSPIKFTSAQNAPSAGDWDYISFESDASAASALAHCILEYGGGYASTYGGMLWLEDANISVDNCTFTNSQVHGIVCDDDSYFSSFTNNTLADNNSYDIEMYGNWAHTIGTGNIINGAGIYVDGDTYEHTSETWGLQTAPYTINGTLYIQKDGGAELKIEAGNTIQFTSDGKIEVGYNGYGTLIANGTEELPILFTSSATQKEPGQWDYIDFYSGATNTSILNHCIIEAGGGYASYYGTVILENSNITITNTEIRLSEGYGISLHDDAFFKEFTGNTIKNCENYELTIEANAVHTIGTDNTWDENGLGIKIYDGYYTKSDETWLAQSTPYVVDCNIYIKGTSGPILRIEAGATFKFTEGHYIEVGYSDFGSLVAIGTATEPITFTTAAPAGTEQPGQWSGIFFESNTMNGSILDYCNISYGGGYSTYSNNGNVNINNVSNGQPTISNCVLSYSEGWGIYINDSNPTLTNNTYIGNVLGEINTR